VPTVLLEKAGHPHLLGDHACAHDPVSYRGPREPFPGACPTQFSIRAPSGLGASSGTCTARSETGDACPAVAGGIPMSAREASRGTGQSRKDVGPKARNCPAPAQAGVAANPLRRA
jgi:hypothetical protein